MKSCFLLEYSYHPFNSPVHLIRLNLNEQQPQVFFTVKRLIWMNIPGISYYLIMKVKIFKKVGKKTFEVSKFSSPNCPRVFSVHAPKSLLTLRLLRSEKSSSLIFTIDFNLREHVFIYEHWGGY